MYRISFCFHFVVTNHWHTLKYALPKLLSSWYAVQFTSKNKTIHCFLKFLFNKTQCWMQQVIIRHNEGATELFFCHLSTQCHRTWLTWPKCQLNVSDYHFNAGSPTPQRITDKTCILHCCFILFGMDKGSLLFVKLKNWKVIDTWVDDTVFYVI